MNPPCVTVSTDGNEKSFRINEDTAGTLREMLFKYSVTADRKMLPPALFVLVHLPQKAKSMIGKALRKCAKVRTEVVLCGGWKLVVDGTDAEWTCDGKSVGKSVGKPKFG